MSKDQVIGFNCWEEQGIIVVNPWTKADGYKQEFKQIMAQEICRIKERELEMFFVRTAQHSLTTLQEVVVEQFPQHLNLLKKIMIL